MVFKNLRLDELYRETGINKRVLFDTLKPSDKTTPGSGSLFPANIERKSRLFPEEYVKYNSSCSYMQDLREFLEFRNICIARERDLYLYNAKFVPVSLYNSSSLKFLNTIYIVIFICLTILW